MTTDVVVKILAVVGGGVAGGLGLGLLAQLLSRAFTTRKLPAWPVLTVRLLGGLICGWLVSLWLFGGGGPGIGGRGGWGLGSGSGKGEGEGEKTTATVKKDNGDKKTDADSQSPAAETLRIEVLGADTLKKQDVDGPRCYRIESAEGPRLLTFTEIKEAIKARQQKQPPLRRIELVLYKDSPDQRVRLVSQLKAWASELDGGKMKVDLSQPDANAPTK
ncbi:MAG TPA: hypothetical protein VN688_00915 [Gemmataceae bacterium]|nr:hypothetical protein [Gemmataceae bacterium]